MNEILKKRIEEAAIDGGKHYNPNLSMFIQGEHVGYIRGFNEGAQFTLSHQWISVDEALPEYGEKVFVQDKYGNWDVAYRGYGDWKTEDGFAIDVAYWMPIPKFETKEKK